MKAQNIKRKSSKSKKAATAKAVSAPRKNLFEERDFDFSKAKRAKDVPHLARLQAQMSRGKTRITIMLDNDVLDEFRRLAGDGPPGYQTLINRALREFIATPHSSVRNHPLPWQAVEANLQSIKDRVDQVAKALNVKSVRRVVREDRNRKVG